MCFDTGILSEHGDWMGCLSVRRVCIRADGFRPMLYFNWYDIFGVSASRFAVQPLGVALSLVLFAALFLLRDRMPFVGAIFVTFLALSGVLHFLLSLGRGDEALLFHGLRVEQWLALVQIAIAVALCLIRWKGSERRSTF